MQIKKKRKNVLRRIVSTLLILGLIIGISGIWASRFLKRQIQNEKYNELTAITNLKVREVTRWIEERKNEGYFLQQNPDFVEMIIQLNQNPEDSAAKIKLGEWLKPILNNHDYSDMHLYGLRNQLLAYFFSGPEPHEPVTLFHKDYLNKQLTDSIRFGDIYYDSTASHLHFDIIVPLQKDGVRLGVIILTINPEIFLFPAIREWPVSSETSEALIAKTDGDSVTIINQTRFINNKPLALKFEIDSNSVIPAVKAILGDAGVIIGTDYRGEKVLASVSGIPGTNWFMIVKSDLREIYAPFWERTILLIFMIIALLIAIGSVLITIWKRNETQLLRQQLELEKETKALEQHYGYLTKYANDIIMLMNEKGDLIQMNERGLEKYGYTSVEIKGMNINRLRAASMQGGTTTILKKILSEGHTRLESIHVTKSGIEFPVEISARSIKIEDTVFIQSIVRDITNHKNYEQAILERENNLNITLESIGDAVIVTNKEGRITRLNKVAEQLTGWKASEAFQQHLDEILNIRDSETNQPLESIIDKVFSKDAVIDLSNRAVLVSKTGVKIHIADSAAPIHNEHGELVGVVIVFRDITEKYQQEQVLRESEEKFRLLAESTPVAIMIYQGDTWVYANKGAKLITGYEPENLLEMNFWHIVHPDDQSMIMERGRARQQGLPVPDRYQFRIISKNGKTHWVDLSGTLIQYNGKPAGMISVMDVTEQKEAMLRIAENESRLSSIFKAAPVGIGMVVNRVIIEVNERVCNLTGYSHEELIGKSVRMLYADDVEYEFVGREKYRQIEVSGVGEVESRWNRKDGEVIDILLRSVPLDPQDHKKGVMFTAMDITARKHSEETVRESQRTLATLMSNLQGIVYRCRNNEDWEMQFLSDGIKAITGFEPDDFLEQGSRAYSELIHPDDRQDIWDLVQVAVEEKQPYEFEFRMKTIRGDYIWVWEKGRGIYDDNDELLFLEGFISDINWRKRNEEIQKVVFNIANAVNFTGNLVEISLLIQQELSKIIDTNNFLIALHNAEDNSISLPFMADQKDHFPTFPAGKTLTGYVISNDLPLLVGEEEIRKLNAEGVIEIHGTVSKSWLGVPLRFKNDVIGALVIQDYENPNAYTLNDLEIMKFVSNQIALSIEKKRAEDELRQAKEKAVESDKLKTAFLANMSHEIRTPMNAIIGFSDLLADKGLNEEDRKNFIHIIQNNGNVLLNLIDDIIDMAKLEAGQLRIDKKVVNINEVLDELFNYFTEYRHKMDKSGIEVRFPNYHGGKLELKTDSFRFRQIISNLINNALKFTEAGFIELGYTFQVPASAPEGTPDPAITFYVKDTGVGIPEDKLNLVFDRFRQAYDSHARIFGGTGLGLTISRNLTEMLGGKIWVESTPGSGTVFYVSLPSEQVNSMPGANQHLLEEENKLFDGSGLHILIAEDEPSSAYFLETIILKTGARVTIVTNGLDALKTCQTGNNIDLVFMDIRMPVMDGYEATQKIKDLFPNLPVIAQTAFAMAEEVERSKQIGCNDHITKPIRPSEIIAMLEKYITKNPVN
ncbi:MAG: PAS domain S-box protein [Bacteroidales bacterium]|nr:PAS domain S-box protein [Bacteroidales bacterium]